jgi:acyl-CoA synthetase (AMP-forming)/AMP-acid ligase II
MLRTQLFANPDGVFLHDAVLATCRRLPQKIALVDASLDPPRRFTYAEYGETVERLARGFLAAGLQPGEVVAIWLPNSWEFAAAYHAVTLAGGIPTPLNPSYREREVRYQLENSGAVLLIGDGAIMKDVSLGGLAALRRVYFTRTPAAAAEAFTSLLAGTARGAAFPSPACPPQETIAALPYSSGTTGLPKGVMLSHFNLVANVYQLLGPNASALNGDDRMLCFLPLYHIYGLTVGLNTMLMAGGTLVLMPRFHLPLLTHLLVSERVTMSPFVPPAINAVCHAAEQGQFPLDHQLRWIKSGAAPLAPELARRFTTLTGILVNQGYGMTEASPVTHVGYVAPPELNRPWTIGRPLVQTECRILNEMGSEVAAGQPGELVMRGPQIMLGYWKEPQATAAVLRDGWYWSGDVAVREADDFFQIVGRRKEMIKYKGFAVAPAEVEAVLLEHPAVRDCGVVSRPDSDAGEIPCAFIVLRDTYPASSALEKEIMDWVSQQLTPYKQPREIHFVAAVPRTPSGKILRRELRQQLT